MSSIYPMPSPNGSNFEKLYVVRGRGPALALDAALRRVGCDGDDDPIENLKSWLRAKLQPDDYQTLEQMVAQIGDNGGGGERNDGGKTGHEEGEDDGERDAIEAKKVPGGEGLPKEKLASDSRRAKSYNERFPDASRGAAAGSSTVKWGYVK